MGSGLAALGAYGYCTRVEPNWLEIERVVVPVPRLRVPADCFRIVQLTDFHLHPYTTIELARRAVDIANRLSPDLVVLTGDYVLESADAMFELAPVLADLSAPHGVFACLGNHDLWTDMKTVRAGLEEAGVTVLVNRGVNLPVGDSTIYLAGLDDGWSGQSDLERALADRRDEHPTILLMHEPDFADNWPPDSGISVQLSGHSHGGQVRLPWLGAPVLPRYARTYDRGLYSVRGSWVYTSRGIGVIAPPVRLGCRPEVSEITLVRGG